MIEPTTFKRVLRSYSTVEPDVLTSFKYFNVFRQKNHFAPEERLMFAVLANAIEHFQKYLGANSRRCRHLFREAESWILSKDCSGPFSFEQICDVLHIDPSYLRLGLTRWRSAHGMKMSPRRRIREPLRYQYRVKHNRVSI